MKNLFKLVISLFLMASIIPSNAQQVKISDNSSATMNANSLLELESTTKGLLPPRVTLTSLTSVAPLTGTVPAGMLVYSLGTNVTAGYYTWDGAKWLPFATGVGSVNVVAKSATGAVAKNETFVAASGNITLTLPVVTSADDGLSITIKNVGTYTDLVTVVGNGGATIDAAANSKQTRWVSYTYIAYGGNWVLKNRVSQPDNLLDVSSISSWTTIPEVIAYLNAHMTGPTVVRLGGESFTLSATQTINLPYSVSFQGLTYGVTTVKAGSAFTGGMFSCASDAYFKFISFESTNGATSGHDCIRLTDTTYHEIKDCVFKGFNKGIIATSQNELWIFECDFQDDVISGIELNGSVSGASLKVSESDFTNCGYGINLAAGSNATVSVQSCGFYPSGSKVGLNYVPATFTTISDMFFTNNVWDNSGFFISGFDFTRSDSRDANMEIENNSGIENKNAKCKINVVNNLTTTTLTLNTTWYKLNWTNTSSYTVNWGINNNKFTFQPTNTRDIFIIVSGNVSVNNANRSIDVGIVKNNVVGNGLATAITRYGETTLRTVTANQPYQYSTTIYIQNVAKNDYFEVWAHSANSGDIVTFQDVNIFVNAQ